MKKICLAGFFFILKGCYLVLNGETEKFRCGRTGQFPVKHVSSSFPGSLIVHGLPVSCPFYFPSGNLKQQLSHIGLFLFVIRILMQKYY